MDYPGQVLGESPTVWNRRNWHFPHPLLAAYPVSAGVTLVQSSRCNLHPCLDSDALSILAMRFGARTLSAALLVSAVLAAACSKQTPSRPSEAAATTRTAGPTHSSPTSIEAAPSTSAWPVTLPVPVARAGLHQTRNRPAANGPVFHAEMTDLWAAVATGRPKLGLPAFFPLVAYKQVKAIPDPAVDWQNRLVAEFNLDVAAAHELIGRHARHAALLRVIVPEAQASWIDPGVCDNGVGYWHVAGARLVYRVGGQERSIGIASLISWRGRWYVVHFGAVLRTTSGGVVDQPALGPGTPGPPGGC